MSGWGVIRPRHLNCNREDLGKRDIERPIDKLCWYANSATPWSVFPPSMPGAVLSAFEHRLDRTARTYLSFIGAPESDRLA